MDREISSSDANRKFSEVLRAVRDERASYLVTSHGKPVAKIAPVSVGQDIRAQSKAGLWKRLRAQGVRTIGHIKREQLYKDQG